MAAQPEGGKSPELDSRGKRLESWKEVAGYLNRHITTIRRWEKHEGLPVHRHRHSKLGSVYAYTRELDAWFETRREGEADAGAAATSVRHTSGRLPSPPWVATAPHEPVHLTGRDDEIDLLRSSWHRASRGQQQIVVVTGEPGVGKTRLALEFARSVAREATVLVGRCDREALVAYAPWVAILQWMVRTTPSQVLHHHLSGIEAGSELAHIVPEIATRIHVSDASRSLMPDGRRYLLFEATWQLLAAASRSAPILLVIDDLHWADRGSLLLLKHVIRATREAAICIVITHRNDVPEWSSEFRDLLESLRREHSPTRVSLHRLSDDGVCQVIEQWTGRQAAPALTELVARHTEGNPLFVVEMLKHLDETGILSGSDAWHQPITLTAIGLPEGIRQLIGRRLERLAATTRRLLTIAAVMGREFRLSVIDALVNVDEDSVLDGMDEALAAGIVSEEAGAPGNFSFTHTLIREALYTSITAARRVRLHHRIADALEQSPPFENRVAELAYHFGQAAVYKNAEKAVHYATRAGDHAAATLAFENAAHWYDMALRAMEFVASNTDATAKRFELQVARGRSFFAVGQWAAAKSAFEAAATLLGPAEQEKRAELLVRLAETAFWLMDVPAIRRFAGEARALAGGVGRDDLWADAQAWTASAMLSDGDLLAAIHMDHEALARAGGIRSFGLARIPLTLYWAGRADDASRLGLQAVETARASEDPSFLLYALQHLGLSLSGAGRFDEAVRLFDEARAFGRTCGALPLLARATSMSVAPLLSLGDLDGALSRASEARELAYRIGFEPPLVSAGIDLLMIFARQQDPGRAEALLDETARAVQKASGWHAWKWSMRLSQARAELACVRGAYDEAVRAATFVINQSRARHRPKYEALGLLTRARAEHRRGNRCGTEDARVAVDVGRRLADPAVLLESLIVLLEIEGTDALLGEARRTAQQIERAVSDEALRSAFLTSVRKKAPAVVATLHG
ncbi:MAG TPA: AAA family ATPase [Vicinamibacterales bacterium]|jgi:tetratricopeptide (TPR) repeat protein|nr:AAA family ATPase [Vicinamibacterales bacterium]